MKYKCSSASLPPRPRFSIGSVNRKMLKDPMAFHTVFLAMSYYFLENAAFSRKRARKTPKEKVQLRY